MRTTKTFWMIAAGIALATPALAQPTIVTSQERVVEIIGSAGGDRFGRPIHFADLDGDGIDDLIVGVDRSNFSGGERRTVHVFRGGPSLWANPVINLATDSSSVRILGETGSTSMSTAFANGDLNNDGYQDLVLVDPTYTAAGRAGAGVVYVLFGGPSFFDTPVKDLATGAWDVRILGAAAGDNTGGSTIFGGGISSALACGDIDNDGIDDLAIGAHLSDSGGNDAGQVRIVKGRTPFASGTTIDLATQTNYRIVGDRTFDELGIAVTIGDINRDGIPDLLMGARYMSVGSLTSEGYLQVMLGRTNFPALTDLGVTAASFSIRGTEANGFFGEAVAVGDTNGDGFPDILVSSDGWDGAGVSNNSFGAIFGFLSRTTWPAASTSTLDDYFIQGYTNEVGIGRTLASADVNGDGIDDIIFGSRDGERAGFTNEGLVFVKYGAPTLSGTISLQSQQVDVIIAGNVDGLQMGDALAVGDIDGDGFAEIAVAAPFVGGSAGRLYLFDLNGVALFAEHWFLY